MAVFVLLKWLIILFFNSSGPLSRTGRPIRKCKLVPERGYGIVRGTGTDNSAPYHLGPDFSTSEHQPLSPVHRSASVCMSKVDDGRFRRLAKVVAR